MRNEPRVCDVDFAKGAGVALMVIGHLGTICPNYIHSWIYSFHMPLFFFCSGIFAKPHSDGSILKYTFWRRTQTLLIPYLVYAFIFLLFDALIQYETVTLPNIIDILLGYDTVGFLWFIYALFFVSLIYAVVVFISKGKEGVIIISLVVMAFAGFLFRKYNIAERAGSILHSVVYYYIGFKCKQIIRGEIVLPINRKIVFAIAAIISLLGTYILTILSGNPRLSIDIHHNIYPDLLLTYIVSLAGIFLVFFLARVMRRYRVIYNLASIIGRESLIIYPIFTYLPLRVEYILGLNHNAEKVLTKILAACVCAGAVYIKRRILNKNLLTGKMTM